MSKTRNWEAILAVIPGYDSWRDSDGYHFDARLADRACAFIEQELVIIEPTATIAAYTPFALMPWQQAVIGALFGWVDADGVRRYRETLIYIPRKAGKTPLCAAIMLYVLYLDGEAGAQCYCAASEVKQAALVFRHARGMVEHNPALAARATIYNSTKQIVIGDSFASVLSAEAAGKHGYNSHLVVVDELHAQPNRDLLDALMSSTSSRRQPLVICITTADYDRPSICNDKHKYALGVRDDSRRAQAAAPMVGDPRFLPVIYETAEDADWENEDVWRAVNPSIGVTKTMEYMRRECQRAKNEPSYQATFRRLELNQRTPTQSVAIDLAQWDACAGEIPDSELVGLPCWGGLDLSAGGDLTALVLCWPNFGDAGRTVIKAWHWMPEDVARLREKSDRVPYLAWQQAGWVEFTPGAVTDYSYIRTKLTNDILPRFNLKDIGADPWNATHIITELTQLDGISVVIFRQGPKSMSAPGKELSRLIAGGRLLHDGNPLMRWQISNLVWKYDSNANITPNKEKSRNRIDGCVAAIMAVGRASVESVGGGSVYETRGVLYV